MKNSVSTLKRFVAVVASENGVVTKKDRQILHGYTTGSRAKFTSIWGESEKSLIELHYIFKGKLSKKYKVLIISEKQYGNVSPKNILPEFEDYRQVATASQLKKVFEI